MEVDNVSGTPDFSAIPEDISKEDLVAFFRQALMDYIQHFSHFKLNQQGLSFKLDQWCEDDIDESTWAPGQQMPRFAHHLDGQYTTFYTEVLESVKDFNESFPHPAGAVDFDHNNQEHVSALFEQ